VYSAAVLGRETATPVRSSSLLRDPIPPVSCLFIFSLPGASNKTAQNYKQYPMKAIVGLHRRSCSSLQRTPGCASGLEDCQHGPT